MIRARFHKQDISQGLQKCCIFHICHFLWLNVCNSMFMSFVVVSGELYNFGISSNVVVKIFRDQGMPVCLILLL